MSKPQNKESILFHTQVGNILKTKLSFLGHIQMSLLYKWIDFKKYMPA